MKQGLKQKNIVIIGAGYAGLLAAQRLEKKMAKLQNISITLIDKNPYFTMRTEIHLAATGRGKPEGIRYDLAEVFSDSPNVSFFVDEVLDIDFGKKVVKGTVNEYAYDYLILSAGSKPNYDGLKGAEDYALPFWTYDDAVALKQHIADCFQKASQLSDEVEIKKLLTFCVVGAGFAGVELASELAEYVPLMCRKYALPQYLTRVVGIDILDRPIPHLPNNVTTTCNSILNELGVELILEAAVKEVTPDAVLYEKNGEQRSIPTCSAIWNVGTTAETITATAAKTLPYRLENQLIDLVNLQSAGDPNVFVIGDNLFYVPKGWDHPVPQNVENAEQSALLAADNIAERITDQPGKTVYKPVLHGSIVTLGEKKGIVYAGIPNKFMVELPSPFAQVLKRAMNVKFLVPVFGTGKAKEIFRHEFLTKRDAE